MKHRLSLLCVLQKTATIYIFIGAFNVGMIVKVDVIQILPPKYTYYVTQLVAIAPKAL